MLQKRQLSVYLKIVGEKDMIHWLIYGGLGCHKSQQEQQLLELFHYFLKYPESNMKAYFKDTEDVYAKVIRLKCNQTYDDLELDCNSCGTLRRVIYKPKNISYSPKLTAYLYMRIGEIGKRRKGE